MTQYKEYLYIHNEPAEKVKMYNYLGTAINKNNDCLKEIRIKINRISSDKFYENEKSTVWRDLSLFKKK